MRRTVVALGCALMVSSLTLQYASASQTRGINFAYEYGFDGIDLDTGYIGANEPLFRLEVRAHGGFGGKVIDVDMPGDVLLNGSTMSVAADTGDGSAYFDLGVEYGASAYFGIPDFGVDIEFDLLSLVGLSNLDMRWEDSSSFTPFLLDSSVTLSDQAAQQTVLDVDLSNVILPGVPFVGAGVTLADTGWGLHPFLESESEHLQREPDTSIFQRNHNAHLRRGCNCRPESRVLAGTVCRSLWLAVRGSSCPI